MEFSVEPVGVEFTFDFKGKGSEKTQFYRELNGYSVKTHDGKYKYDKKGVLSNLKHLKPTRSTIIVSRRDAKPLKSFFKKFKKDLLEFDERVVLLKATEAKKLGYKYSRGWGKVYEEIKGNENLMLKVDF